MITVLKKQTKEPISFFIQNLKEVGSDGIGTFIKYVPYYSKSFMVKEYITEDYKEFLCRLEKRNRKRRVVKTNENQLLTEVMEMIKYQRELVAEALDIHPVGKLGTLNPFSMHIVHEHVIVVLESILQKCGQDIPK